MDLVALKSGFKSGRLCSSIGVGTVTIKKEASFNFSKEDVIKVLIGEPLQMNGQPSESTAVIEKFVTQFKSNFPEIKVDRVDERFTSKMAMQTMLASGLKKKQRQNKALVDEISATIMLQDYLTRKMF